MICALVKSDSPIAINWVPNKEANPYKYHLILNEMMVLSNEMMVLAVPLDVKFCGILREANGEAGSLAERTGH